MARSSLSVSKVSNSSPSRTCLPWATALLTVNIDHSSGLTMISCVVCASKMPSSFTITFSGALLTVYVGAGAVGSPAFLAAGSAFLAAESEPLAAVSALFAAGSALFTAGSALLAAGSALFAAGSSARARATLQNSTTNPKNQYSVQRVMRGFPARGSPGWSTDRQTSGERQPMNCDRILPILTHRIWFRKVPNPPIDHPNYLFAPCSPALGIVPANCHELPLSWRAGYGISTRPFVCQARTNGPSAA